MDIGTAATVFSIVGEREARIVTGLEGLVRPASLVAAFRTAVVTFKIFHISPVNRLAGEQVSVEIVSFSNRQAMSITGALKEPLKVVKFRFESPIRAGLGAEFGGRDVAGSPTPTRGIPRLATAPTSTPAPMSRDF